MATTMEHPVGAPQQQQEAAATAATSSSSSGPIIIDTQHDDMVHDSQLDYYGCKLATASSDRTVKIYDVSGNTYAHTATLQGHEGPVWEITWSHPKFGVVLASCSFDGSVLIHRESPPGSWTLIHAARGLHDSSVNGVTFAPHEYGLMCAAASSDGRVSFLSHNEDDTWSVEYVNDNSLGVNAVTWAPYVPLANAGGGNPDEGEQQQQQQPRVATAGCDNRIRFWTRSSATGSWEEETTPLGHGASHTDWVRDVAWAPPIVPGVDVVASCSEDGTVIVWTHKDGGGDADGTNGTWEPTLLNNFGEPVWRLSWSVTGSILAVSSGDSTVTLWKAGLDGTWKQVTQVEDVVGGSAGGGAESAAAPAAPGGVQQ